MESIRYEVINWEIVGNVLGTFIIIVAVIVALPYIAVTIFIGVKILKGIAKEGFNRDAVEDYINNQGKYIKETN